jgi:hypothetical protein
VGGAEGTYVEVHTDGDGFQEDAKSRFERGDAGSHASRSIHYEYHLRLMLLGSGGRQVEFGNEGDHEGG